MLLAVRKDAEDGGRKRYTLRDVIMFGFRTSGAGKLPESFQRTQQAPTRAARLPMRAPRWSCNK
eukprot:750371-Pyramimonas_sp.AAC.1